MNDNSSLNKCLKTSLQFVGLTFLVDMWIFHGYNDWTVVPVHILNH